MQRLYRLTHYRFLPVLLICASLMSACSSTAPAQRQQYDFGPFNTVSLPNTKMQIALAEIQVPAALDSNAMLYRLQYDNAQQLKPYAQARWSMPPAQLVAQRIKLVLNSRGAVVTNTADSAGSLPVLRLELDEFSQIFTTPSASHAHIYARGIVLKGRNIVGTRNFLLQIPAASADAASGAKAMQTAVDTMINDMQKWLNSLALN